MKRFNILLLFLLILSVLSISCSKPKKIQETTVNKYANRKPKVLIVNSYDIDNAWTKEENQPIINSFQENGYEFQTFYMNINANSDEAFKSDMGRQAMEKYLDFKPDIVVAADDEAQEYFAGKLSGQNEIDIVFCGLEGDPARYNYPNTNVTGILERPQVGNAIRIAQTLFPGTDTFTVLTDNTETSKLFISYLKGMNLRYQIAIETAGNFAEWKEKINGITGKALILYKYDEIAGADAAGILKWTVANASVPTIAFSEFAVQNGILFAVVESAKEQGSLVAKFVTFMEQGRKVRQIPISMGREGLVLVNRKQALKYKLDITKIHIDKMVD